MCRSRIKLREGWQKNAQWTAVGKKIIKIVSKKLRGNPRPPVIFQGKSVLPTQM